VQEERARHLTRLAAEGATAAEAQAASWQAGYPLRGLLAGLPAGAEADAAVAEATQGVPHLAPGLEIAGLEG
jgi:hypothetical protein